MLKYLRATTIGRIEFISLLIWVHNLWKFQWAFSTIRSVFNLEDLTLVITLFWIFGDSMDFIQFCYF